MKTTHKIFLAVTLILGVLFFALDRQLFYYGKNDFNIYGALPLKIKPVFRYDFEGGFALEDGYGFRLISRGDCQYVRSDIKLNVKNITGYGFAEDTLIASVVSIDERKYFIKCVKNNNPAFKQDMIINVLEEGVPINQKGLKWVDLEKDRKYIRMVELFRNYSIVMFIVLFLVFVYWTYKKRKGKAKTPVKPRLPD